MAGPSAPVPRDEHDHAAGGGAPGGHAVDVDRLHDDAERRRAARLFLAFAVILIPWVAYLAVTLPHRAVARHYDAAWVGFDCLIVLSLALTAWRVWRRQKTVVFPAIATAALLMADAWFDVVTSSGWEEVQAWLLAVLVELPCAVLSVALARRAIARMEWKDDDEER